MFELTLGLGIILVCAAFFAGFVDSIAGGGGLITLPALLLAGMNPTDALATNKLQGSFGSASAALAYARAGHVDVRRQFGAAGLAFAASALGAWSVQFIPVQGLRYGLPVVLVAIALFFALKPGLNDESRRARMSLGRFHILIVPLIAFYDGLVGPGAGSFYMTAFVLLAGYGVLKATAHTKLLNFASNFGSLLVFVMLASPSWGLGLAMGAAQALGARVGAACAMRIGARIIKPLLVVTSTALAIKLIADLW